MLLYIENSVPEQKKLFWNAKNTSKMNSRSEVGIYDDSALGLTQHYFSYLFNVIIHRKLVFLNKKLHSEM